MTVVHNANTSGNIDHLWVSCDGVGLSTRFQEGATVVAAAGEMDAFNIHHFSDCVGRCLSEQQPVVLDLTELNFVGAQAVQALFEIGDKCAELGVAWAVVPSHPVSRLLRVCDTEGRVPSAPAVSQALERVSGPAQARRLLQLVAEPS